MPYLAITFNDASISSGAWDYYKLRATIPAAEAFRPLKEGGCPQVSDIVGVTRLEVEAEIKDRLVP